MHVIPCLPLTTEMPPFEGSSVLGTSLPQEQMEREEAAWKETQVRGQRLSDQLLPHKGLWPQHGPGQQWDMLIPVDCAFLAV